MTIGVAASFATTLIQYFSPTKSPFYPIVAIAVVALEWSTKAEQNWAAFYWPLALVLLVSTVLAFMNRPEFEEKEYNDQIKFARAAGVSSGVLCLAWMAVSIVPYPSPQPNYHYWAIYFCCVAQAAVLLLYTFVYYDKHVLPVTINFVQLALMTATFVVGATYAAIEFHDALPGRSSGEQETFLELPQWLQEPSGRVLLTLLVGWLACMLLWCNHLRKVFRLTVNPSDIRVPASGNVVHMVKRENDKMAG